MRLKRSYPMVVMPSLLLAWGGLLGQNVVYIGDVPGGEAASRIRAVAVSGDGPQFLAVGNSQSDRGFELTTFSTGNEMDRPQLYVHTDPPGSVPGSGFKTISDITPDGSLVVGRQYNDIGQVRAFVSGPFGEDFTWLSDGVVVLDPSRATGISDDGTRIVGIGRNASGQNSPVYWDEQRTPHFLPEIPGHPYGWAYCVSADGQVIVGFGYQFSETFDIASATSFVWTEALGMRLLPPVQEGDDPVADHISADGTMAAGLSSPVGAPEKPAYWTLDDLQAHALPLPAGFEEGRATTIFAGGTRIAGIVTDLDVTPEHDSRGVIWDLSQPNTVIFFQDWAEAHGCSFNGATVEAVFADRDGEAFYGHVSFPGSDRTEGFVAQIDPAGTDLTIVGRLPYPNDQTQETARDAVFLRDIDPGGRLAGGQGNFHESENLQMSIPVRWTPETGLREIQPIADTSEVDAWTSRFNRVYDVTTNGRFMVGQDTAEEGWGYGFIGTAEGPLGRLPVSSLFTPSATGQIIFEESRAFAISDDGSFIVGAVNLRGFNAPTRAAYWDGLGEVQQLPLDPEPNFLLTLATDTSANGSTIVGLGLQLTEEPGVFPGRVLFWNDLVPTILPLPEGFSYADTFFLSHDGKVSSGRAYNRDESGAIIDVRGVLWYPDGSFEFGPFPETWTDYNLGRLNYDGSIVVGSVMAPVTQTFIWDRTRGIHETKDYLETVCGLNVGPYEVTAVNINDEGTHILGQVRGKYGDFAFFVELPEDLHPEAAKYLWRTAPARDDPWRGIDGFGWLYDNGTYPWVWHTEHGWIYTTGTDPGVFLMFDSHLQAWWRVNLDYYPWMYKLGQGGGWFYYYAPFGTPGERFFYDPSTGQSKLESEIFP